jgi:cytochrome P450
VTLFVAGHETTATALTWAFHLLAQHPEVRERLEAEVAPLGDRRLTADDAAQLPLAGRIFKEALRLFPPVPAFARQSQAPVQVGGYDLPPGTIVFIAPYTLHRRPDLWPEPEKFLPDRFEDPEVARRSRHAFLAFSSGPRVCLGQYFAILEGQLLLATIARRVRFEPDYQGVVEPDVNTATLRPSRPLPMRVRHRAAS